MPYILYVLFWCFLGAVEMGYVDYLEIDAKHSVVPVLLTTSSP